MLDVQAQNKLSQLLISLKLSNLPKSNFEFFTKSENINALSTLEKIDAFSNSDNLYKTFPELEKTLPKEKFALNQASAEVILSLCHMEDIRVINFSDNLYPKSVLLNNTINPPVLLFTRGNNLLLNNKKKLGVIGTKAPSESGRIYTQSILNSFSDDDYTIVSNLSDGISSIAHETAVKHRNLTGSTIAIMSNPLDNLKNNISQKNKLPLAETILSHNGLIVSEYLPFIGGQYREKELPQKIKTILDNSLIDVSGYDSTNDYATAINDYLTYAFGLESKPWAPNTKFPSVKNDDFKESLIASDTLLAELSNGLLVPELCANSSNTCVFYNMLKENKPVAVIDYKTLSMMNYPVSTETVSNIKGTLLSNRSLNTKFSTNGVKSDAYLKILKVTPISSKSSANLFHDNLNGFTNNLEYMQPNLQKVRSKDNLAKPFDKSNSTITLSSLNKTHDVLSNDYQRSFPLVLDNRHVVDVRSSEQAYYLLKAFVFNDQSSYNAILNNTDPNLDDKLGRNIKTVNPSISDKYSENLMKIAQTAKFSDTYLKRRLFDSGNTILKADSPCNVNWSKNENALGNILTGIRDTLQLDITKPLVCDNLEDLKKVIQKDLSDISKPDVSTKEPTEPKPTPKKEVDSYFDMS